MRSVLASIVVLVLAAPAPADVTVRKYATIKNTEALQTYIGGVGAGYAWANARLTATGRPPLYCEPEDAALAQDNYVQLLAEAIKDNGGTVSSDTPIALLLLLKMIQTYPCPIH
jgi:hypothetical protein